MQNDNNWAEFWSHQDLWSSLWNALSLQVKPLFCRSSWCKEEGLWLRYWDLWWIKRVNMSVMELFRSKCLVYTSFRSTRINSHLSKSEASTSISLFNSSLYLYLSDFLCMTLSVIDSIHFPFGWLNTLKYFFFFYCPQLAKQIQATIIVLLGVHHAILNK